MKQVLTVVAVMLLLAMPCRAAGEPEQVEGLDELWQAAESYGVEPDGDLSGGLSGLAEQALGQAGELLRRSAQTGLKLLAVAVFCGLAEGVYAGKREGGLQAVQMAGTLAVTALSVSDMQTMIGLGRQTIEQMDGFAGLLLPVDAYFAGYPAVAVSGRAERRCRNGNTFPSPGEDGTFRVYGEDGAFLMLGRRERGIMSTVKSFFAPPGQ